MAKKKRSYSRIMWQIFSVFVAIILWFVIINIENPSETIKIRNIKINVINEEIIKNDNLVFSGLEENDFSVRFEGTKLALGKLEDFEEEIVGIVDLNDYYNDKKITEDDYTYLPVVVSIPIAVKNVIKVESQSIQNVKIKLEEKVSVVKSIESDIKDSLPENYDILLDRVKILPNNIDITGAKSKIDKIDKVKVELNAVSKDVEAYDLPVNIYDAEGKIIEGLTTSLDFIKVQTPIIKKKTVKVQAVVENLLPEELELEEIKIEPSEMIVGGEEKYIDALGENFQIKLKIDPRVGTYSEEKELVLGTNLMNLNDTNMVKVSYKIRKNK